jgi:deazaflavin-dependent oxidoreductase (nitroreductase family)
MARRILLWLTIAAGVAAGAYAVYARSHLHTDGNRLFYAKGRPNVLGRAAGSFWSRVVGKGAGPDWFVSLETVGRRSGEVRAVPVVLADVGGERYVVSMLGTGAAWVHNLRASDGRAVLVHGTRTPVRLVEVPVAQRAPIIKAYVVRAVGGRPHIPVAHTEPVEAFEPIAADYPVYRVEPDPAAGAAE